MHRKQQRQAHATFGGGGKNAGNDGNLLGNLGGGMLRAPDFGDGNKHTATFGGGGKQSDKAGGGYVKADVFGCLGGGNGKGYGTGDGNLLLFGDGTDGGDSMHVGNFGGENHVASLGGGFGRCDDGGGVDIGVRMLTITPGGA